MSPSPSGKSASTARSGVPIWPLKMLIPAAGVLLTLQGIAEVLRCVLCLREGAWPPRMHDVEELETMQTARSHASAQASRSAAPDASECVA